MIFESKVAVANVWTAPQSPREIDQKVLQGSFKIKEWIDQQTYEEKLALCEENLIQSQVLLGERVIGLEETDGWMKVVIPQRGQPETSARLSWLYTYEPSKASDRRKCASYISYRLSEKSHALSKWASGHEN